SEYNEPDYTVRRGVFDTSAYASDVVAADRYGIDADPAPYQRAAAHERTMEHYLLYLSVALVVSLILFTVGRLVKGRRRILAISIPGWAILAASATLFTLVEL